MTEPSAGLWRWEDRQRAFQARVVLDEHSPGSRLTVRPYRTFHGDPIGKPPAADSRLERAAMVLIAGTVMTVSLALIGGPRTLVAIVAGLAGGVMVFAGLAGPDPRASSPLHQPLLAIFRSTVQPGDLPDCVTQISPEELTYLGDEGYATVIGTAAPLGTFGAFLDDYLVWPRTPPRGNRRGDPPFGTL